MNGEPYSGGPARRDRAWNGALRGARPAAYTVSAINAFAKAVLERELRSVWVEGEVTGWKRHSSGHCYFTLRDRTSRLRAVMWRSDAQRLPAEPDEGMQVRALGTVTVYERSGEYQLVVRELDGLGPGGLWRVAFERLRRKLEAEGLLAPERKRPLPAFPSVVGVVTSPVGAALHDILRVIGMRAPWTRVVLAPARVQGDGAGGEVARAIRLLARTGLADVIIVGRGGGSVEDLWAFNDEAVARSIASCPVPVISAVGHEVDITIADLVADWRAATPSAAAERAVPDRHAVARELAALRHRMANGLRRWVEARQSRLERAREALHDAAAARTRRSRDRVAFLAEKLEALSPLSTLRRGYAVALGPGGHVLRQVADFPPELRFRLRVADGTVDCRSEGGARADAGGSAGSRGGGPAPGEA